MNGGNLQGIPVEPVYHGLHGIGSHVAASQDYQKKAQYARDLRAQIAEKKGQENRQDGRANARRNESQVQRPLAGFYDTPNVFHPEAQINQDDPSARKRQYGAELRRQVCWSTCSLPERASSYRV